MGMVKQLHASWDGRCWAGGAGGGANRFQPQVLAPEFSVRPFSQLLFAFLSLIFSLVLTPLLSLSFYHEVLASAPFWSSQDLRILALDFLRALVFSLSDLDLSFCVLSLSPALLCESLSHPFKPLSPLSSRASLFPMSSVSLPSAWPTVVLTPLLTCAMSLAVLPWLSQFLLVSLHPGSHFLACVLGLSVSVAVSLGRLTGNRKWRCLSSFHSNCTLQLPRPPLQDRHLLLSRGWRRGGWWVAL